MAAITVLDRRELYGTGVSEPHADHLLDKVDEIIGAANANTTGVATNAADLLDRVRMKRLPMTVKTEGEKSLGALHATKRCLVLDVSIAVETAEASGTTTVDVGVTGVDTDGFANDASVAAIADVRPGPAYTTGGSETYMSANTRGELLAKFVAGSDVAGDHGLYVEFPYWLDAAGVISYTVPAGGWTEFVGYLLVTYVEEPAS